MKLLSSSRRNTKQAGMQVTLLLYLEIDCNGDTEKTTLQKHCNNTISIYLRGKAMALCKCNVYSYRDFEMSISIALFSP